MAGWDTVPAPNYASFQNDAFGNALSNLVPSFQAAQQGQQRTQANDLRNQQDQLLLNQSKAFAGGVPTNADGSPNYSAIMKTLAEKGDINSIQSLAPIIQQQQNIEGANAPDPIFGGSGGGSSSGGAYKPPSAPAAGPWSSNAFLSTQVGAESEGDNKAVGDNGLAKGDFQFHDATWQRYAKNVPGASQYASAADAPPEVQQAVAETAPLSEWGPRTKAILHAKFGNFDDSQTVGQLAAQFGGGAGAAGSGSTATAYASSDKPAIPPVSAAAGSSIPRGDATTATQAVGGAPAPAAAPNPLAASNPAWGGLNAALPVGQPGGPTPPGAAPAQQAPPAPPAPGSVASIAAQLGIPAPVAANIAKAVGAPPDAPLNPQQAARAKQIIQNYAQRAQAQNGQQQQQGAPQAQGQPQQGGGPIVPQFPLPPGIKDPQQAILAIDQDIARLGRFGPAASGRIKALEDMRERIAQSSAPLDVKANTTLVDPRTREVLYQGQQTNAGNIALQRFLQEKPDATPQEIQQFVAAGRGGARSPATAYLQRFMQENPNAGAEDIAKAAQDFQSQGSSLTKFDTGKQGDSVRSFNVLVDHLGSLSSAADALKNGNIPVFNKMAQSIAQQTGQPAPVDFDAVKNIVGDELVKAILGGGAALGDREEMKATINKANSPAQLSGVIEKYKNLALGQLKGLRKQYESSTGRDDFDSKLAPGTKSFFEGESKDGGDKGSSEGLPAGWTVTVH